MLRNAPSPSQLSPPPSPSPDLAQHPLVAIRKCMIEKNHKYSSSPSNRRNCSSSSAPAQESLFDFILPLNDEGKIPSTPNPPYYASDNRLLSTPRTPGRNHEALAQDPNWAKTPPRFFVIPRRTRRRLSGVNLEDAIERAVDLIDHRCDEEDANRRLVRKIQPRFAIQPRFESRQLSQTFASISSDGEEEQGGNPPPPPLPSLSPPLHEEEEETSTQGKKQVATQNQEETPSEPTTSEESSSIPTSKLAAMNLAGNYGSKLSENASKALPKRRKSDRPRRRMSAPSA